MRETWVLQIWALTQVEMKEWFVCDRKSKKKGENSTDKGT